MDPPWKTKPKVCIRCKRDCAALARIKNPQGQYMCRDCYDREALKLKDRPPPAAVEADSSIPLEEVVNSGEGLGANAPAPGDPRMCAHCGMILHHAAVICMACGMNSTTGLFLTGKPAPATTVCVKCGYDMRGLKTPRCPECGTVNTRAKSLRAVPESQTLQDTYLRPAIYFVLGAGVSTLVVGLRDGWSLVPHHMAFVGGYAVCSTVAFAICAVFWLGFEAPLPVIFARIAGIVALADAVSELGAFIPYSGLWLIFPLVGYVALLMDLFDIDYQDAVIVTLVSGALSVGGWFLLHWIL